MYEKFFILYYYAFIYYYALFRIAWKIIVPLIFPKQIYFINTVKINCPTI